jgi:hypothetical protein
MTNELILRRDAAEATLAQYSVLPFVYGRNDCVRMTAAHLRRMGYRVSLVKGGSYRNEATALKALAHAGFKSIEQVLDEKLGFIRIPPASALVGDIMTLPTDGALSALAVCLGNNVVLHTGGGGFTTSRALEYVAAWRVPYAGKSK